MVYDFSGLAPFAAIEFDTDEECLDIIRSATPNPGDLRPMFDRMKSERFGPYAISISCANDKYDWGWCDVEWYKDNGYTVYHVSEIPVQEDEELDIEFEPL